MLNVYSSSATLMAPWCRFNTCKSQSKYLMYTTPRHHLWYPDVASTHVKDNTCVEIIPLLGITYDTLMSPQHVWNTIQMMSSAPLLNRSMWAVNLPSHVWLQEHRPSGPILCKNQCKRRWGDVSKPLKNIPNPIGDKSTMREPLCATMRGAVEFVFDYARCR